MSIHTRPLRSFTTAPWLLVGGNLARLSQGAGVRSGCPAEQVVVLITSGQRAGQHRAEQSDTESDRE